MPAAARLVFDIKYRANQRSEVVKNVVYGGLKLRETDSASIMALQSPEDHRTFTVDVGAIEWIKIDGKIKKLRSPGSQHRLREAELKFLLQGKQREDWTDPYLRSYDNDQLIAASKPNRGFFGWIIGGIGFIFLSIPGLACLGVAGFIGYVFFTMMHGMH